MSALFNTYLYHPILVFLEWIYQTVAFHDLGVAIIELTVIVRVVLYPLFYKGAKDQALMQRLQPSIQRIQKEHKDDKERQARELMSLYKENRLNPLSGILLLIVQFPIFIALFQIFKHELTAAVFDNHTLFGLIDVGTQNLILVLLAVVLQLVLGNLTVPKKITDAHGESENPAAAAGRIMKYVTPVITGVILLNLPAALGIYWSVSTAFSIVQQLIINKKLEEAARKKQN